ncbi:alpha-2-macroglobulin-like protein 1 isoform X3 [Ixodes scapularis]|uniref:alpha-2-macroglobulin-like protein 1 isoform X3 n=1 Tax=Ixodes scapularis TaxID=6945 RepID=UPI001C38DE93|nr:alpha-2-macroglobulin-like protein 1 isoform X3 [Ixodes scapularis]
MLPPSACLFLVAVATLGAVPDAATALEYIFTAPGYVSPGTTTKFYAVVRNPKSAGTLDVELWDRTSQPGRTDTKLASKTYQFENKDTETELEFEVPQTRRNVYYNLRLRVVGKFGGATFENETYVYLRTPNDFVVLVQTDKPKYRQGSTVNYRVVLLTKKLLPVVNQKVNISISNPFSQLLSSQQEVQLEDGLFQGSYKLLEITEEGSWSINVQAGNSQGSTSFQVEDYVLPKFFVSITPDANDVQTNPTVDYKICAKYTYGKDVKGAVEVYASSFSYYYPIGQKPVILRVAELDGCYNYTLNVSLLNTKNFTYSYYPSINITAKVLEKGTGVSETETTLHNRNRERLRLNFNQKYGSRNTLFVSSDNTFKLNMAYKGLLFVQKLDGTPQPQETIQLCLFVECEVYKWRAWQTKRILSCRNYTSDNDGVVRFSLPQYGTRVTSLSVEALAVDFPRIVVKNGPTLEKPSALLTLKPFYSPSGNSLLIDRRQTTVLECRATFSPQIQMTAQADKDYKLFFTLTSSGRVLDSRSTTRRFALGELIQESADNTTIQNEGAPPEGSVEPTAGENPTPHSVAVFTYEATLPEDASPKVQLLVYYVLRDAQGNPLEVVSDSAEFAVDKCLENKVSLSFSPDQALPGSKVSVELSAESKSLCGVGALDSSVTLLDGYDRISRNGVLNTISNLNYEYSRTNLVNQSYCYEDGYRFNEPYDTESPASSGRSKRQVLAPNVAPSYDSLTSFENAGVVVFSNLAIQTRPCNNRAFPGYPNKQALPSRSYQPSFGGGGFGGALRPVADAQKVAASPAAFAPSAPRPPSGQAAQGTHSIRTLFPETWLWQIKRVGEDGQLVYEETLPDTITRWEGSALCLHPEAGFGISQLANVTGFQPLFVSLTLPQFMKRGEVANVILTAFSYVDKCVAVRVHLESVGNLEVGSSPNTTDALLCPGGSASFTYGVRATKLETARLRATVATRLDAQSDYPGTDLYNVNSSDTVLQTIQVRPEGFPVREVDTYLLCASDEAGSNAPNSLKISLPTPNALVEDSEKVVLVATGDILALEVKDLSVPKLVFTSAEGTLAVLASSAYLLRYLEATGADTPDLRSQLLSRIQQAYQSQYGFRSSDGSYGPYSSSEYPRSVFLSAFAVKALTAAKPYIGSVDSEIQRSIQYVLQQRDRNNGCFQTLSPSGPFNGNYKNGADLSLVVANSLLEGGYNDSTVYKAVLECVDADNLPSNHTLALNAYFSALIGEDARATNTLNKLLQQADKNGGLTTWDDGKTDTAGYAILTMKALGQNLGAAQPIVRWLMQQVFARYSFSYSQAYSVAVQGLTEYSRVAFATPTDLTVTVEDSQSGATPPETFAVSEQNKLVYQEKLLNKRQSYDLEATLNKGSKGCAAVQVKYYYNSKNSPVHKGLQVNATSSSVDCGTLALDICARYTEGFLSSAAVVEISLLTGFSADDQSLKELVNAGVIKKYVVTDNKIQLLIQQLYVMETCFRVLEKRDLQVSDVQPGVVELFDYYRYQYKASASYEVTERCTPTEQGPSISDNEIGEDVVTFQ